jgi:hypothetical protein
MKENTQDPTARSIEFGIAVEAFAEETPTEQRAAYIIEDLKGANWYAKKQALIDWEIATIKAQATERVKQLESDRKRLENLYKAQFESVIFAEAEKRRGKTVTLDFATVSIRTVPAHVKISNEEEAIAHARSIGDGFVSLVPTLDTTAYRKHAETVLETDGTIPAGCEWIAARESVTIKTTKSGEENNAL